MIMDMGYIFKWFHNEGNRADILVSRIPKRGQRREPVHTVRIGLDLRDLIHDRYI